MATMCLQHSSQSPGIDIVTSSQAQVASPSPDQGQCGGGSVCTSMAKFHQLKSSWRLTEAVQPCGTCQRGSRDKLKLSFFDELVELTWDALFSLILFSIFFFLLWLIIDMFKSLMFTCGGACRALELQLWAQIRVYMMISPACNIPMSKCLSPIFPKLTGHKCKIRL